MRILGVYFVILKSVGVCISSRKLSIVHGVVRWCEDIIQIFSFTMVGSLFLYVAETVILNQTSQTLIAINGTLRPQWGSSGV